MRHNLVSGWHHTEEARNKIAVTRIGPLNVNFGKPNPRRKMLLSKEQLKQKVDGGQTVSSIAVESGINRTTVQNWLRRYDIRLSPEQWSARLPRGADHHMFQGFRKFKKGYAFVHAPSHPAADLTGYVLEHRLMVEQFIGRLLAGAERVHHIDFDKAHNEISNLILFHTNSDHILFHHWMEMCGACAIGAVSKLPPDLEYTQPILVAGKWTKAINFDTFTAASTSVFTSSPGGDPA